jgi:uncharacterized protein (DUF697 family)
MIMAAAAGAYAVGWTPIPWGDAASLSAIEVGLIASMASQYGFGKSFPLPAALGIVSNVPYYNLIE